MSAPSVLLPAALTASIAVLTIGSQRRNPWHEPGSHPEYAKIIEALRPLKTHAAPYQATLYRCVEIAFAHDFVSGKGAQLHGGRWNPKVHWRAIQHRREAVSQAIGRALHQLGLHALLASSQARSNGRTIVLFPDQFTSKDRLSAPSLKILTGNIS